MEIQELTSVEPEAITDSDTVDIHLVWCHSWPCVTQAIRAGESYWSLCGQNYEPIRYEDFGKEDCEQCNLIYMATPKEWRSCVVCGKPVW